MLNNRVKIALFLLGMILSMVQQAFSGASATSVVCTGINVTSPIETTTSGIITCSFSGGILTTISGTFSPTTVSLTGPSAGLQATFGTVTSPSGTILLGSNGSFTVVSILTEPVIVNTTYSVTPPYNTLAGNYTGSVTLSWTAL